MVSIIDTAYVEILPELGKFTSKTKAEIDSTLAGVGKSAGKTAAGVGTSFENSGKRVRADVAKSGGALTSMLSKTSSGALGLTRAFLPLSLGVVGIGIAAVKAAKSAGDFDSQLTRLVTSAGESSKNVKLVADGEIAIARSTGESLKSLSDGAYMIESAGFHGRDALNVLRAAAQGAKIDMADAGVVGNALTTVMNDIHAPTSQAATVMSQLVAAVGRGKMTMDDLAGSIHSVLPNASALGLSVGQVGGALATMTAQGIGAAQASQNLNHAILSLANPTAEQTKTMAAFGLNASDVAKNIGKVGLTGTLQELSTTIMKHMGPAGLTLTNAFNTSEIAAGKAKTAYDALPKNLQRMADGFKKGTLSVATLRGAHSGLTLEQKTLLQQWVQLEKRASGFSDLLKSGSPSALTYTGALAKMTGGSVGLQVALHLTGENMKTYLANVDAVSKAHQEAGGNVEGWAIKEQTFNQRLSQVKETIATTVTSLMMRLLPAVNSALGGLLASGPKIAVIGTFFHTTFNGVVLPVLRDVSKWIGTYIVPSVENLISIFMKDFYPAVREVAKILAVALVVAFRAVSVVVDSVLGPALLHATAFLDDHRKTVYVIAGVITFVMLPALVAMAAQAVTSAASTVVSWGLSAAAAVEAGVVYTITNLRIIAGWVAQAAAATASGVTTLVVWTMYRVQSAQAAAVMVLNGIKIIASWVAQAASAVAAELVSGAAMIAMAARWVWLGVQATASALRVAAAWIISIGPIAIVIAIVVGLVVLIIRHWSTILAWTKRIWTDVRNFVVNAARAVINWLRTNWPAILAVLTGPIGLAVLLIVRNWDRITAGARRMRDAVGSFITGMVNFVRGIPARVVGAIGRVGTLLVGAGRNLIGGMLSGIKSALADIGNWVRKNVVDPVINAVKRFFGINSPSTVFAGIGGHLVAGLFQGILKSNPTGIITKVFGGMPQALRKIVEKGMIDVAHLPRKALDAIGSLFGMGQQGTFVNGLSGGLDGWLWEAIAATGVPMSWLGPLHRRAIFESGGNPNAINLTDSNAKAGHPSMGLMQTIASTFARFSLPGFKNIFDPVANAIAAIRYILSRYGSIAAIDPPVRGYERGAWNVPTNQLALLHKSEMVVPASLASQVRSGSAGGAASVYFAPGAVQVVASPGMNTEALAQVVAAKVGEYMATQARSTMKGLRR